jgi:ribosomal protein L31
MPEGGKLTIETTNSHLDDAYVAQAVEVAAGQYVAKFESYQAVHAGWVELLRYPSPALPFGKQSMMGIAKTRHPFYTGQFHGIDALDTMPLLTKRIPHELARCGAASKGRATCSGLSPTGSQRGSWMT